MEYGSWPKDMEVCREKMKPQMQDIFEALDKLVHPLDYVEKKPKNYCPWFPDVSCDICGTSEKLVSEQATVMIMQQVPKIAMLRRNEWKQFCEDCLARFIRINARVMQYDRVKKQYRAIASRTYDFRIETLKKLIEMKSQKPSALQVKVNPKSRTITREFQRRRWFMLRNLSMKDNIDRLYEGYGRLRKPEAKPKNLVEHIRIEDVVDVLVGRAKPRPAIDCKNCTKAVCPIDCVRRTRMVQLEIFMQKRKVSVDEYNLSQYEDFP